MEIDNFDMIFVVLSKFFSKTSFKFNKFLLSKEISSTWMDGRKGRTSSSDQYRHASE